MQAGIVGSGLIGRLLAYRLIKDGWQVSLFDKGDLSGKGSAAYAAAGMLSPIAEQESTENTIYQLGKQSLNDWSLWLSCLKQKVYFQKKGTILLAHAQDFLQLKNIAERLKSRTQSDLVKYLDQVQLQQLESELFFNQAYFLKGEAQVDTRALLMSLAKYLLEHGAYLNFGTYVTSITPGKIEIENDTFEFDWVFDCRGIGAQQTFSDLRGVRGELLYLYAPEVNLKHMIRFIHPRYRLYVIPRPGHIYLVGATEIESCDSSPISVRSCLEFLTAAYSIHKNFAEARIVEMISAVRSAFPNNLPRLYYQPQLIAINGLYRHGFLIAPTIVKEVISFIKYSKENLHYPELFQGI